MSATRKFSQAVGRLTELAQDYKATARYAVGPHPAVGDGERVPQPKDRPKSTSVLRRASDAWLETLVSIRSPKLR